MPESSPTPAGRDRLLARIAARAAVAMAAIDDPQAAAARRTLASFDAGASAMPAWDLYESLREAEHAVGARQPALARRLRRLGRLVERLQRACAAGAG